MWLSSPKNTASRASVLSKLPPHVLETGGLEPSTQSPQNQQAYLGSLAERFLPVDLSVRGLRVLNVDPPVFAIPDFVSGAEADALAKLAKGGTKLVRNAKTVDLSAKLPAPMGENMPALAQRLGELVEDAKKFVRCDGAWLEGSDLTRWAPVGGFTDPPPPGAFAFEMPALCHAAKSKTTDDLPDAFEREAANEKRYQRRALVRVFLTDPPAEAEAEAEAEGDSVSKPEMDREAFGAKFVICDVAIAPRKGTAIVTSRRGRCRTSERRSGCAPTRRRRRRGWTCPSRWASGGHPQARDDGGRDRGEGEEASGEGGTKTGRSGART